MRSHSTRRLHWTSLRRTSLHRTSVQTAIHAAHLALVLLVGGATAVSVSGCRVNQDDLHRWENTERGPEKIQAVLEHDKYEMPLRIEAAVSLIRMKARGGRFVGIEKLVDSLSAIPSDQRDKINEGLIPTIIGELRKDPPPAQAGQPPPPDPSFAYKDAAYALLFEQGQLVSDDKQRQEMRSALKEWAMKDFDHRLENRAQKYSMEQLLQQLGPEGVEQLPDKISRDSRNLEKMASLIDQIGSKETREAASVKLVEVAKYVLSNEWLEANKARLEAANAASGKHPTPEQFKEQLETYQDEELQRDLGTLKKVGGRAAVDFALELAKDKALKEDRRVWALAALELRLDPKNAKDVERIFAIALDTDKKTTPKIQDMAFSRIGEMERDQVIGKLYDVFTKTGDWRVRRQAGGIILRMSEAKHLPEFMSKLPEKDAKGFAVGEARTYADYFVDWKDFDIRKALEKYQASDTPTAQRAVAFAFYDVRGTEADIAKLKPWEADKGAVPSCDDNDGCKWLCPMPKDDKKPEGEKEVKEVKTFGDYVTWCVEPDIKARAEQEKKEKKGT